MFRYYIVLQGRKKRFISLFQFYIVRILLSRGKGLHLSYCGVKFFFLNLTLKAKLVSFNCLISVKCQFCILMAVLPGAFSNLMTIVL